MILVTVGATYYPFDRLLAAVETIEHADVLVQHGASSVRPRNARCVEFMPFEEVLEHIRAAHVVVTHAGTGSILVALANGKRPVVVPRRREFGEAIDDHQVEFARALAPSGLVTVVEDPETLSQVVAGNGLGNGTPPDVALEGELALDLGRYLRAVTDGGRLGR
jgi:UDP-N-acetylglucosamine transferase subunit ALG13